MNGPMTLIAIVGVIVVASILIRGVYLMATHEHDDAEEERMMFARVATQAAAVALLLLAAYAAS
jgi:Hypoxia induced protein conserved region